MKRPALLIDLIETSRRSLFNLSAPETSYELLGSNEQLLFTANVSPKGTTLTIRKKVFDQTKDLDDVALFLIDHFKTKFFITDYITPALTARLQELGWTGSEGFYRNEQLTSS